MSFFTLDAFISCGLLSTCLNIVYVLYMYSICIFKYLINKASEVIFKSLATWEVVKNGQSQIRKEGFKCQYTQVENPSAKFARDRVRSNCLKHQLQQITNVYYVIHLVMTVAYHTCGPSHELLRTHFQTQICSRISLTRYGLLQKATKMG